MGASSPVFSVLQLTTCPKHLSSIPSPITYHHHPKFYGSNLSPSARNKPVPSNSRTCRALASDVSAITWDPSQAADVSWQIVVGAVAGVTPFVVAGIEFSKRIVAQRKCKTCKGSGLVLRDNKYYFRCPACGGFLPWQSWTRFFTG